MPEACSSAILTSPLPLWWILLAYEVIIFSMNPPWTPGTLSIPYPPVKLLPLDSNFALALLICSIFFLSISSYSIYCLTSSLSSLTISRTMPPSFCTWIILRISLNYCPETPIVPLILGREEESSLEASAFAPPRAGGGFYSNIFRYNALGS